MTSSLVGSEMCIRDRASFAQGVLGQMREKVRQGLSVLQQLLAFLGRLWDCLLYTSDAADDM
eukprot:1236909-Prorocentrum_lima.AAC.1